jgi:hypothetical protein
VTALLSTYSEYKESLAILPKLTPIRLLLMTIMLCTRVLPGQTPSGGASSRPDSQAATGDADASEQNQPDPESMLPHFQDPRF